MTTKEEDTIADIKSLETHDNLLFFTNKGKVYQIKAYEISESSRTSKGTAVVNLLNIEAGEKIESFVNYKLKGSEAKYVFLTTKNGTVKKSALSEFENIRRSGILAIKLEKDDELVWSKLTSGNDDILLVTRNGKSIRFTERGVRPMGRNTMGVRGILIKKDSKDDRVIQMDVIGKGEKAEVLTIMEKGLGKKTGVDQFHVQGRGGQGVKVAEVTEKTGKVVTSQIIPAGSEEIIITSEKGQIVKLEINSIPRLSRATQGVILMRFSDKSDRVASATCIEKS
jgi:DNA gyrase subunit A